uniref:Uncharacterized protein LOC104210320 n=1 Tax=Nicotiana sylvestris TaxID=4096 RepID=A0A1U7V5I4_NICSY|nr:PREDICTED: uncharacterized protein LOC104210320 [Nicotiana sylvestris]
MLFGLKNTGATYIRAMMTRFHNMIHKEIEIGYNLKLNPVKCMFGVSARKLFGFIISRKGIELDPSKIKAIQELPPPESKKDVMNFLGRLNYISRFIAQSIVICQPIFKLLKKYSAIKWTKQCQKAFDIIKEKFVKSTSAGSPEPEKPLLLYLIQNEFAYALATLSSMVHHPDKNYIDVIKVEIRDQHAYCFQVDEEPYGKLWEVLYRRIPDLGLLRCLDATEATRLLQEIHRGTCEPHMNALTLAKKILRGGYLWMTIASDIIHYVQKCHQFQIHEDFIRVLLNELNVMGLTWSFAA